MVPAKILLAWSVFELHLVGGPPFMFPLLLMLLINAGIFVYALVAAITKKQINSIWMESVKQIGTLAAAWGTWSTIIGLFFAFNAIENSKDVIPFPVICGGMKVALITVLYGLLIFCLSLLAYIIIKFVNRNAPAA